MALVNSRGLLRDARANGYAVGAFNVENMEMMQAVIAAAEAEHAPVILQTTPSTLKYAEPAVFAADVTAFPLIRCHSYGKLRHFLCSKHHGYRTIPSRWW